MAYESKVTNKYFGTTFAGGGKASVQETELSGLVKALGNSLPQLQEMGNQYIKTQEQEAATEITKLNAQGKSTEEIKKIIDSGENEALSSMYATATNNLWLGKLQAAEDIRTATSQLADYNPDEQTMDEFLADRIGTDFSNTDKYYAGGYASVFNEKKAQLLSKDAEERYKRASTKKVTDLSNFIRTFEGTTEEGISFHQRIPRDGTYTNTQINDATVQAAEWYLANAETTADIDRAMSYLEADRGTGKNGMKLGSLISAGNQKAIQTLISLKAKRISIYNRNRIIRQHNKEDAREEGLAALFNKNITKDELIKNLSIAGALDSTTMKTIDYIEGKQTYFATPKQVAEFRLGIANGQFNSQADMFDYMVKNGIAYDSSFATIYKSSREGELPVYEADHIYSKGVSNIINAYAVNFEGKFSRTKAESIRLYVQDEILDRHYTEEPKTVSEKRAMMREIMQEVEKLNETKMFGADNTMAEPKITSVPVKSERDLTKEFEEDKQAAEEMEQEFLDEEFVAGVTPKLIDALSKDTSSLRDNKPVFTEEDKTLLRTDAQDERAFRIEQLYPYIAKEVSNILGFQDQESLNRFVANTSPEEIQQFVELLAEAFGVTTDEINQALSSNFAEYVGYTPTDETRTTRGRGGREMTDEERQAKLEEIEEENKKKTKERKSKAKGRNK